VLLHLHLLLLLDLHHLLVVAVVVALVHLVELTHIVVVGQRAKGIVVEAAMVTVPLVVVRQKVRELICSAGKSGENGKLVNWELSMAKESRREQGAREVSSQTN